ncbi:MAG TPA: hypothetical protein VFM70_00025 [Salinimicrobium sp.]|nr:hypothetical protein [Salinimicrobium sp.]
MKNVIVALLLLIFFGSCKKKEETTNVMVLSSIHGAHAINPNYSYKDLFNIIETYNPDIIGVEIRSEDMGQDDDYLKNFYPLEMRMVKDSFPTKSEGLDFYGEEVKGKLIPIDAFKDSTSELGQYVYLEKLLVKDSVFSEKKMEIGLKELQGKQTKMALESSAEELMNGIYDMITREYYLKLDSLLLDTPYEYLSDFNTKRDVEITANALNLIKNNTSKKILILVGANHRGRIIDSLKGETSIKLIENLEFISIKK